MLAAGVALRKRSIFQIPFVALHSNVNFATVDGYLEEISAEYPEMQRFPLGPQMTWYWYMQGRYMEKTQALLQWGSLAMKGSNSSTRPVLLRGHVVKPNSIY